MSGATGPTAANYFDRYDGVTQPPAAPLTQPATAAAAPANYFDRYSPPATQPATAAAPNDPNWHMGQRVLDAGIGTVAFLEGLPQTIAQVVDWAGRNTVGDPGLSKAMQQPAPFGLSGNDPAFPTAEQASGALYNMTGTTPYQPQTAWGEAGQAAMNMLPAALLGGGFRTGAALVRGDMSAAGQAVKQTVGQLPSAAAAGVAGQAAANLLPDSPDWASVVSPAAAILGGAAFGTALNIPKQAISPGGGSLDPARAQLAQQAMDRGIPLGLAQVTDSLPVKTAASVAKQVPFGGGAKLTDRQLPAYTASYIRNAIGGDQTALTPATVQANASRIGGVFNGVAQRTSIPVGNMVPDVQQLATNARLTLPPSVFPTFANNVMNIYKAAAQNGGNLGGDVYLKITGKGGPLDTLMQSSDPSLRQVGGQLRDMLDDHLAQNAAPGDVAALTQARAQWKALKTVEPLTVAGDTIGGATPSTGIISPLGMRQAVNRSYGTTAGARGYDGEPGVYADIGQAFLKEPPDSGTAGRAAMFHAGGSLASAGGAIIAGGEVGLPHLATVGGLAASALMTRLGVNPILQSQFLARQAVNASLNPDGFRFSPVPLAQQLPFSMGISPQKPRADQ